MFCLALSRQKSARSARRGVVGVKATAKASAARTAGGRSTSVQERAPPAVVERRARPHLVVTRRTWSKPGRPCRRPDLPRVLEPLVNDAPIEPAKPARRAVRRLETRRPAQTTERRSRSVAREACENRRGKYLSAVASGNGAAMRVACRRPLPGRSGGPQRARRARQAIVR